MASLADLSRRLKPAHPRPPVLPRLILIVDRHRLADPLAAAERLPRRSAVILRDDGLPGRLDLAQRLRTLCRRRGLLLVIGGDPRLAGAVHADGLHLKETQARREPRLAWRRRFRILTAAAHTPWAIRRAAAIGADAVLLAPVFATASHPGAPPIGPLRFTRWLRASPLPVYALGGITPVTARRLTASGAAGFAAIGAFAQSSTE